MQHLALEYPIPQKFKEQGTEAIKKYLAIRTEKIEQHLTVLVVGWVTVWKHKSKLYKFKLYKH